MDRMSKLQMYRAINLFIFRNGVVLPYICNVKIYIYYYRYTVYSMYILLHIYINIVLYSYIKSVNGSMMEMRVHLRTCAGVKMYGDEHAHEYLHRLA
jgi:hypothetical protein